MSINAFKMDGLGNDFVIIDVRDNKINLSEQQIIKICDRNFLGCDQLILIDKNNEADAQLIFYNSDGSESGACGNGTRCVAYLISKEMNKKEVNLITKSGKLYSKILGKNLVETTIGKAKTDWREIPLSKNKNTKNLGIKIEDKNQNIFTGGTAVNVGNPHTIFFVDNINNFDLEKIGPKLETSSLYPERCNITLAKIENKKKNFCQSMGKGCWINEGLWISCVCNSFCC